MTAEFQFAHFSPGFTRGVYRLLLYRQPVTQLLPVEYELMSGPEQQEVCQKVMRKAPLMLTLTPEAPTPLGATYVGTATLMSYTPSNWLLPDDDGLVALMQPTVRPTAAIAAVRKQDDADDIDTS